VKDPEPTTFRDRIVEAFLWVVFGTLGLYGFGWLAMQLFNIA
jgi:hypothetical protein